MISVFKMEAFRKIRITQPISGIAEIRLRAGRPAVLVDVFGNMGICSDKLTAGDIDDCFSEICQFSVHSFQSDIAQGFITLDGGHRVGICGTAVKNGGKIEFLKNISGLNIRIAHEVCGCADELYERVFSKEVHSLLIGGKPLSGKTTVLRDLARRLGERRRVSVIDSRNEISASVGGAPSLDIGLNTDVLCGCDKSEGIMMALRSLSPEVIICDEIADDEKAIEEALFCGVKVIASAHGGSLEELKKRGHIGGIMPLFDYTAILGERGKVTAVHRGGDCS